MKVNPEYKQIAIAMLNDIQDESFKQFNKSFTLENRTYEAVVHQTIPTQGVRIVKFKGSVSFVANLAPPPDALGFDAAADRIASFLQTSVTKRQHPKLDNGPSVEFFPGTREGRGGKVNFDGVLDWQNQ